MNLTDAEREAEAIDAERALEHIAGRGHAGDAQASAAYHAVWMEHVKDTMGHPA